MHQTWTYRRTLAAQWFATLGLALTIACGPAESPAPSPQGGVPAGVEAPRPVATPAKYAGTGEQLVDLSTFPEPGVMQAGGMPPSDLTATPKPGGVIRMAWTGHARLDPHYALATGQGMWLHRVFANGLLRWDLKCGCPQPDLAESWTVAPDGLSYDFKVRKGMKFQNRPPANGRAVTMQDVKWSLDRISGLEPQPGKQGIFWTRYANVKEFQIIDDTTLRVVMKQPDVQILAELMYDYVVVLPKEAMIDNSYEQAKTLIGTGPFMVDAGTAQGNFRLSRNPDYWEKDKTGRQLPYLDSIETANADAVAFQSAFKTRQLDTATLAYGNAKTLMGLPDVRSYSPRGMTVAVVGIYMNTTKPPFNDVRVRRAVNLGLDRVEIMDAAYEGEESHALVGPIGNWEPWHWGEAKMWTMPGFAKGEGKTKEIAEAKRLLAEAGYATGMKLTFWDATATTLFDVLQKQMSEIGIELTLQTTGGSQGRYATFMKDKDIAYAGVGGGHTPDYGVTTAYLCSSAQNMSNYCNPEIDKLFKEERQERDTAKRMQLMDKIQQILWADMPMAPLSRGLVIQLSYINVKGWRNYWYDNMCCSQGFQMANVWLDR